MDLEVLATADPRVVAVRFVYPGTNEKIELRFEVNQTAAGPRIHDIKYQRGGFSLREMLSRTLDDPTP